MMLHLTWHSFILDTDVVFTNVASHPMVAECITIRFCSPTCGPTTRWASLRSSREGWCTPYRVELRECVLAQWLGIRVYFGPDPDPLSFFPHISPEPFSIFPPWNRIRVRNADPDSKKVLIVAQKISQKSANQPEEINSTSPFNRKHFKTGYYMRLNSFHFHWWLTLKRFSIVRDGSWTRMS